MTILPLIAALLLGCGCTSTPPGQAPGQPPVSGPPSGGGPPGGARRELTFPVDVQVVESRSLAPTLSATGSLEAWERVQVTARVEGAVDSVDFAEGDEVEAGRVLLSIDPERFRLAERAAHASWDKERIEADEARAALERREAIDRQSPELVADEELSAARSRVLGAEAEALRAEALWKQSDLDLQHARVRAPLAGRIEARSVETGAWVRPGTVLGTLLRQDPMLLRFAVAADEAARLTPGQEASFVVPGTAFRGKARLRHVGGQASTTSRLVPVVAEVHQGDPGLRPGAFAQVEILLAAAEPRPVVPQGSVRPSERGFLAYVVVDGKAQERVLALGMRTGDGLIEVESGLAAGETLVVRGAEALRDGATVAVAAPGGPP